MVHISICTTLILFSFAPEPVHQLEIRSTRHVLPSIDALKNPTTDFDPQSNSISKLTLPPSNEAKHTTLTYVYGKRHAATQFDHRKDSANVGSEDETNDENAVWMQKWPFDYRLGFNSNRPRVRTLRTEKMSKDGVIEGELTFHSGNGISRGVRYTVQPGVEPLLLYRTLLQFLALEP